MKRAPLIWLLVLLLVCVVALIPAMPTVSLPKEDSGIFLYFGQQILAGKLPYADLFDHKPPLVFYLNALGLSFGSAWGVWVIQLLGIGAASAAAFATLRRFYGTGAAVFAVLAFLLNLVLVMERGNLTELYALPFQFGALALFAAAEQQRGFRWRGYLIGIFAGLAFMLRQNLIGLWLALGLIVLIQSISRRSWRGVLELLRWAAGAALVVGAWVVYFAWRGALTEFWDVAFVYNFVYSSVSNVERLASLGSALEFLANTSGFFIIGSLAWGAALLAVLIYHAPTRNVVTHRWLGLPLALAGLVLGARALIVAEAGISAWRAAQIASGLALVGLGGVWWFGLPARKARAWLARLHPGDTAPLLPLFIAVIGLPIEIALLSLSATNFAHYFMTLLPVLTLLVGFFAFSMLSWSWNRKVGVIPLAWLIIFFVLITHHGIAALVQQSQPHLDEQLTETTAYIKSNTQPSDKILVWGFNTGVYYLSGRQSSSRLMMQGPLFRSGYTTPTVVNAFWAELKAQPPQLIIDTRLYPFIEVTGQRTCAAADPALPAGLAEVFAWVCDRYDLVASFGRDHWLIYRLRK